MASLPVAITVLLLLSLSARALAAAQCTHSSHCVSADPSRLDLCAHRPGFCLSLPSVSFRQVPDLPTDSQVILRTLPDLITEADALPFLPEHKRAMVRTVKTVYHNVNPHRFLHQNFLHVDFPAALERIDLAEPLNNTVFYDNMTRAFQLMDDKHSVFLLPYPFNSSLATLGFDVKIFFDDDTPLHPQQQQQQKNNNNNRRRRYVVSDIPSNLIPEGSTFGPASELLSYAGLPIDAAVRSLGNASYASNPAARIDYGLALLSLRILIAEQIPFEPTVDIAYVNPDGEEGRVTLPWLFVEVRRPEMLDSMVRHFTSPASGPFRQSPRQSPRNNLQTPFSNPAPIGPKMLHSNVRVVEEGRIPIPVDPAFEQRFQAEVISTSNGPIGLFVLPDFGAEVAPPLVEEITRVLGLMPKNGLIMDLRDNAGGHPDYVKLIVELVTGITPPQQPTSLRATQLFKDAFDFISNTTTPEDLVQLSSYRAALDTALRVGEPFTGPTVDLYSKSIENVPMPVPQAYFGPVVTLFNGMTYSGGDLYSSLQDDLDLSLLVGVSDNVGAGGASTVSYEQLVEFFPKTFDPLPGGAEFGTFVTSFARYYRSGKNAGAIVENFGFKPHVRYYPTLDDALKKDCDLFEFLGKKLQEIKTSEGLEPEYTPEDIVFSSPEETIL